MAKLNYNYYYLCRFTKQNHLIKERVLIKSFKKKYIINKISLLSVIKLEI